MADILLQTEALTKRFGGLVAVDNVGIDFRKGEVHCVIGPNGAGKTTLINLLSGDFLPTSGTIRFDGQDITSLASHRVSRLGIGRSYQRTNIFPEFTVRENCWLGAQSRLPSCMRFVKPADRITSVGERAMRAMEMADLTAQANLQANRLSHGEQRQLEIAVMLATEPKLLLLDEPMAGMSGAETTRMVELIRKLKADHTLILIEHDMDAVFAVADTITVMVNGAVLASGAPDSVRGSKAVQDAYLGEGDA